MGAFTPPANTFTSMDAVHDAVIAALRAKFGDRVAHYGAYEPWAEGAETPEGALLTPALLLEVEDFSIDDAEDPDPLGRLAVRCSVAVHCLLSIQTQRLAQTLAQFAAVVASLVMPPLAADALQRGNDWGLGGAAGLPAAVSAQPAGFSPGLNGRDSWVVRWEQVFYLDQEVPL